MKGYSYNYGALREWLEENKKRKTVLKEALGHKNYQSINCWIDGKNPVPAAQMIILCNTLGIPLEKFFFYNGYESSVVPGPADKGCQTVPTGGWKKPGGDQHGPLTKLYASGAISDSGKNNMVTDPYDNINLDKLASEVSGRNPEHQARQEGYGVPGSPWSVKMNERMEAQAKRIEELEAELKRSQEIIDRSREQVKDRDRWIEDLHIQVQSNTKLVQSLSEQNDFMREQVRMAQHANSYRPVPESYPDMLSDKNPEVRNKKSI